MMGKSGFCFKLLTLFGLGVGLLRSGGFIMTTAGQKLRTLRERLGLTLRDVESASYRIAARYNNPEFGLPLSRLSDIETKGIVASVFRLYSLAVVYRLDFNELLSWFGIDMQNLAGDLSLVSPSKTHVLQSRPAAEPVRMPVRMDPGFDLTRTSNLGRMIEKWGIVPLTFLQKFEADHYSYGYVGTDDFTLYPLVLPGSFLQIDENKNRILGGGWRSEYERPIYFVETREGYFCSWCSLNGNQLVLQPHALSPTPVRSYRHPQEAEIIGQVVGIAMRLDEWRAYDSGQFSKVPRALTQGA
jgi:hypothetical protein